MRIKNKQISDMSEAERNNKIKELRLELVKNQASSGKGGKSKVREIKKTIARLLTFNRLNKKTIEK